MDKERIKCKCCCMTIANSNPAIGRHVKRHDVDLYAYIRKYYTMIGESKFEDCGFCELEARPNYIINHINETYEINYNAGYSCETLDCKKKISLSILNIEYDPKKFEKIGSRSVYLSKLHKIPIEESNKMKYNENTKHFDNSLESFIKLYGEENGKLRHDSIIDSIRSRQGNYINNLIVCDLEGFIEKHGQEIGTNLYKQRCDKISYTNTLDYYIERFGEEEGKARYKNKIGSQTRISKKSKHVGELLDQLCINYKIEENIGAKSVDYYLPDYNIAIEYYGDYWHCNPKKFESIFFHSHIKLTAKEIWEKDQNRLDLIMNSVDSILVIWENSNIDSILLDKMIKDIKNKKTIMYI